MFADKIKALAQRAPTLTPHLETEEATKNALIMPFIAALGYDVFNPVEVVPEFTADVGIKKGEKVDYAIKRDGEIIILIEAKKSGAELNARHSSQLFRYFTVTKARIAILTNGTLYQFFSDIEEKNKMDSKPFLELNLLDLRENTLAELSGMTKASFDLENMLSAASELKYMREIRAVLAKQLDDPDEDFVRFFFNRSNPGRHFVQSAREQFTHLVKKTMHQLIVDRVQERLRSALARENNEAEDEGKPDADGAAGGSPGAPSPDGIETTEEELEGYKIVKAIVCKVIDPDFVAHRDTKSYFNVLFDDNARKPICRLYLNRSKKYIGLFDERRKESKIAIDGVQDIYKHVDKLRATAELYVRRSKKSATAADSEDTPGDSGGSTAS